jgi:hypothetical protein
MQKTILCLCTIWLFLSGNVIAKETTAVDILTLRGQDNSIHAITKPGRYILTSDLQGCESLNGISILANDVTLDLNGYGLVGTKDSLSGIIIGDDCKRVTIENGRIERWDEHGIFTEGAESITLTKLYCIKNNGDGISLADNVQVTNCQFSHNTGNGVNTKEKRNDRELSANWQRSKWDSRRRRLSGNRCDIQRESRPWFSFYQRRNIDSSNRVRK